ncbi:MAG: DNA polymerase, partial [Candidatus Puniceispirillum sp.]
LINTYGDLDNLLDQASAIKQPKRRENLLNFAEQARISRELVRLKDDVPLTLDLPDLVAPARDMDRLTAFLQDQEFNRLLVRIGAAAAPATSTGQAVRSMASSPAGSDRSADDRDQGASDRNAVDPGAVDRGALADMTGCDYQLITDVAALTAFLDAATAQGILAVDTETTSLNAAAADLVGVSMALAPGRACYVPLRHGSPAQTADQGGLDFAGDSARYPQIPFDVAIGLLRPVFENPAVLKIGHNLKYDSHVLRRPRNGGIRLAPVDDTMCLSYVLDGGRVSSHSLDNLAKHWLDHDTIKFADICGKGAKQVPFGAVSPEAALDYAAEDADVSLRLWHLFKPRLGQELLARVYERLERPLIPILADMEARGITVDRNILARMSNDFAARMADYQSRIHELAGTPFNIASPKQLGEILFDQMGLEGGKKAKTGAYSTSADVLEDLAASGVEIAREVLEWRQLAKLKSTYADALVDSILAETGRVHTSFSMVGASTGRLSSSDPNVQNIPIRTAEGRQIRTAFVAASGCQLISAD